MTYLAVFEGILRLFPQLALKFHRDKTCFFLAHIDSVDIDIDILMTVQEAHKEYNSLMDKIRAKYEQLDSGKFGSPGTPAFDAEACELANLLAHVSQLCTKLNLLNYTGPHSSSIEDAFGSKLPPGSLFRVWRMQLCSHR